MSEKTVKYCDVCGIEKKDVNHWFKVWIEDGVFGSAHLEESIDLTDAKEINDACGQPHAIQLYGRYLSKGTFSDRIVERETEDIGE